jgi:hypothetical protein
MYRREREFNIISGESLPFSTQTYRSASNFEKVRKFENNPHLPVAKLEKLGHSKDRREYQYSYESIPQAAKRETGINQRGSTNFEQTMLNSVSTDYNIVNLKAQHPTSKVVSSQIFNQVQTHPFLEAARGEQEVSTHCTHPRGQTLCFSLP